MDWHGKRVFITGADGFIGSHLAEELVSKGAEVTALAQYNSLDSHGWLDDVDIQTGQSLKIVRGDIRDPHQMEMLCRGQTLIFHLAALIAIPYSYVAPSSYVQTNMQGTLNVMQAALTSGVERFIHTSTSEVYGTALTTPIKEDHPLQGQSPYSASKIAADMMAEAFFRSYGLPVITLRPFNTYGPRQSERAVISTIIRQVIDERCQEIYIGDTRPRRDFNFVSDTVSAFLAAAGLAEKSLGETFNAGSGKMISIGELVDLIRSVTNSSKRVVQKEDRKRPEQSEVMTLLADTTKLRRVSDWMPSTSFKDGLKKTAAWWSSRAGLLRRDSGYMI